jgi:hypothetical protein
MTEFSSFKLSKQASCAFSRTRPSPKTPEPYAMRLAKSSSTAAFSQAQLYTQQPAYP